MFEKEGKKEPEDGAIPSALSNSGSTENLLINPAPIKEQLEKINSLIDRKREGLLRKEKDMAAEDKTPASSKFLIAFFAFLGGEAFKLLWKKLNHKETVPNVASNSASIGHVLLYSLLSSLVSTLFSLLGYKIFGRKKKN